MTSIIGDELEGLHDSLPRSEACFLHPDEAPDESNYYLNQLPKSNNPVGAGNRHTCMGLYIGRRNVTLCYVVSCIIFDVIFALIFWTARGNNAGSHRRPSWFLFLLSREL